MKKLNVLDLFCGAGGLSYGFERVGFNIVLGIDNDTKALVTFKANHKNSQILCGDITKISYEKNIKPLLKKQKIDVIIGGPPCQGFSLSGPRNFNDPRNKLYLSYIRLVKEINPKAFVIENVPGLVSLFHGEIKEKIISALEKMGYNVQYKILCAADFGVPQTRKRVFFVGTKKSCKTFSFPKTVLSSDKYVTCAEAIDDLPSLQLQNGQIIYGEEQQDYLFKPRSEYQKLMRQNSRKIKNHIGSIPIEKTRKMISLIPEGKNYKSLPKQYSGIYKYHEALTRYDSKKPSLTINTGHRSHFHYKYNRIPTVRESARLQSFPDDFIFYGNKSEQYRQVGNAVPPLLGSAVAKQLLYSLGGKK